MSVHILHILFTEDLDRFITEGFINDMKSKWV
jgi:hypothetical protein